MGIIIKEFDNTLEKSEIVMPLLSSSKAEAGEEYEMTHLTENAQTAVFGIQVPLIMINSTVIDFDAVKLFNLKSINKLPELTLIVEDRYKLITNIDKPNIDNEVRIQILPKFEDAYKKINLTFYITKISVTDAFVQLNCTYKLIPLSSSQFKTFGEIDTYNLFRNIALDTGLGFATNITEQSDKRYVYCDHKSLLDIMSSEIEYSDSTEHILDWWIDYWDNINLADVKERYNTIDKDEDMQIWVTGQINEKTIDNEIVPNKVTATINNYPGLSSSELFVNDYELITAPGSNMTTGTDTIYSVYEDSISEYMDYLVQDGDVKNDIFIKYNYLGENYGEYNYMLAKYLREKYFKKLNSEYIRVKMPTPVLGLMRGHKVNFIRYVNDDKLESRMKVLEKNNIINRDIESNISLKGFELPEDEQFQNGNFKLDKTVSAQYLIHGVEINYNKNAWEYVLTLVKPASTKVSIINEE